MSEHLVVRLAEDPANASWVVLSEQGHQLSQTMTGPLAAAATQAAGRNVLLLVPGIDALTTSVTLPVKRQSRIEQMLPYTLEDTVAAEAQALAQIPLSQLAAMKLVVNQAYENMGLRTTQTMGSILDGYMRNTPEAHAFVEKAVREGVPAAVAERDGPFEDYSQRRR